MECSNKIKVAILGQKLPEMAIVPCTKYDRCTIEPLAKATGFLKKFMLLISAMLSAFDQEQSCGPRNHIMH